MYNSFHDGAFVVQITENTLSIATTITSNYQHGRRGIFLNSYKVVTFTAVTLSELSMKLVGWPMWFFPVLLEISLHFPSHSALGTVLGLWQDIQWHEYNMSHTHTHIHSYSVRNLHQYQRLKAQKHWVITLLSFEVLKIFIIIFCNCFGSHYTIYLQAKNMIGNVSKQSNQG